MIQAVSIRSVAPNSVLRIVMREPWSAATSTGESLVLRRPRTHSSLYRSEFFAVVETNFPSERTLQLRVADYRAVGIPDGQLKLWRFAIGYDFIKSGQLFTPPESMTPYTALVRLAADRISTGSAPKLNVMPHFTCAPLDLT